MTEIQKVFVRRASGIVRNLSGRDALILTSGCSNIAGANLAMWIWAPYLYSGSNLVGAVIIGVALGLFQAVLYAIFAASMPRAGGDYVYISRTLHPSLGFAGSFGFMVTMVAYAGVLCWLEVSLVSSSFVLLGTMFEIDAFLQMGVWMMSTEGLLVMGTLLLAAAFLTVAFGVKILRRITLLLFAIGMIWVVVTLLVFALNTPSTFQPILDEFIGTSGAYQSIIDTAGQQGFSIPPVSLYQTLGASILVSWGVFGYWTSSYYAGEMKEVRKSAFTSMAGTLIVWGIFSALFAALLANSTGFDFLASSGFLYYEHPELLPMNVPPTLPFLAAIMVQNPIIAIILAAGLICWAFIYFPAYFMPMSRVLFAWSWDRIIPSKISSVSKRFYSPIISVGIIAALFEIFLVAWLLWPEAFMVNLYFCFVPLYIMAGIAGVVFPYVKKEIYQKSAFKPSIGPIPLISIAGLITILTWIMIGYFIMVNPAIIGAVDLFTIALTIGIYVVAIIGYYLAVYYHKRKGIDIRMIFKEIPPE